MSESRAKECVVILLKDKTCLEIIAEQDIQNESLIELTPEESQLFGEEPVQLLEGCSYEYYFQDSSYSIAPVSRIVKPGTKHKYHGRIETGIYVGRLALTILKNENPFDTIAFEIRSRKTGYRKEYRSMLRDITEECIDLLMSYTSPVTQRYEVDHAGTSRTLYQRFAFVKALVDSDTFRNSVQRVISMPVTGWKHTNYELDIRRTSRLTLSQLRHFASEHRRIQLPPSHFLHSRNIDSVPIKFPANIKTDTVDIPENRFVKHVLKEFAGFCTKFCALLEQSFTDPLKRPYVYYEGMQIVKLLTEYLNHAVFREIGDPKLLPLNSPVLQRKEGYRELLRFWLMFDLAARLTWDIMDDETYSAGKRNVATIYEYWVFFALLDIVKDVFHIEPLELKKLIEETPDKLGLRLRQGNHIALSGTCMYNNRSLKVCFHYNRSFRSSTYPNRGSYSEKMRPDYTLSIWPADFDERDAEHQEQIIHIHFDAKYKVDNLRYLTDGEPILESDDCYQENSFDDFDVEAANEKELEKEGKYTRGDLLKMHAYKDAIRRTAGAYILYPGSESYKRQGFHEIIPGLGAFPLSPSKKEEHVEYLKQFIHEVVKNFTNRASQREEISYYTYDVNRIKPDILPLNEPMPEIYNSSRMKPPAKTTVLIGYYYGNQYDWIKEKGYYNIPVNRETGLGSYGPGETGAGYILLHTGDTTTSDLWEIEQNPVLKSSRELIEMDYPRLPKSDYYLVYKIKKADLSKFNNAQWNISSLKPKPDYKAPFAVTLKELLKTKVM